MNENLKNLLEKISADEDLCAKFEPISKMEDKAGATEAILALAAEAGMPLTAADLEPDEELDLEELDAVSGGLVYAQKAPVIPRPACTCIKAAWGAVV